MGRLRLEPTLVTFTATFAACLQGGANEVAWAMDVTRRDVILGVSKGCGFPFVGGSLSLSLSFLFPAWDFKYSHLPRGWFLQPATSRPGRPQELLRLLGEAAVDLDAPCAVFALSACEANPGAPVVKGISVILEAASFLAWCLVGFSC